jgi:hypothetical protein
MVWHGAVVVVGFAVVVVSLPHPDKPTATNAVTAVAKTALIAK